MEGNMDLGYNICINLLLRGGVKWQKVMSLMKRIWIPMNI